MFRPQQPMRHKAAALAKRLARHASQAHVLARPARQKAGRLKMARPAAAARVRAHLHLPERLRPPRTIGWPRKVTTYSRDRILILTALAGCALLGAITAAGDSSALHHAAGSLSRQIAAPPPTTSTSPASSSPARAPSPAPPPSALVPAPLRAVLLLAAADPAGLRPAGVVRARPDRPRPDDRHRGLVRVPDDPSRPAGLRQRIRAARAAVPAGPAAGRPRAALRSAQPGHGGCRRRDHHRRGGRARHGPGGQHPAGRDARGREPGRRGLPAVRGGGELRHHAPSG